jgi:hypothetical protein
MSDTADVTEGNWPDDVAKVTQREFLVLEAPTQSSTQPSPPGRLRRIFRALWLEAGVVLLVAVVIVIVVVILLGLIGSGGAYDGSP